MGNLNRDLTQAEKEDPGEVFWDNPDLPYHEAPESVTTHVDCGVWRGFISQLRENNPAGWKGMVDLAELVLKQLEHGASSGLTGEGLAPINVENRFQDIGIDAPRVLDALLQAVKMESMAGPYQVSLDLSKRINGFLSIPKPGGDRRQVGDFSQPPEKAFNSNVDITLKELWPLTQLTAKNFSFMIRRMGLNSWMGKSDLSQAYKCIPVTVSQRALQRFRFGNRIFEDLRLVFGDCYAPQYFDRFHHVLLYGFVLSLNKISPAILGKCLDDVPLCVPENKKVWLVEFFLRYRRVCSSLGVKVSAMDRADKSFESVQRGEVLGIVFDTKSMTWTLPEKKRLILLELLHSVSTGKVTIFRLKFWERLLGKLIHFYQLWSPGKFFTDSFIKATNLARLRGVGLVTSRVKRDASIWIAALEMKTLPILQPKSAPPLSHFKSYSDASGDIMFNPGVGLLIPAQFGYGPRVASWEFPRGFLDSVDEEGHKAWCKTTTLETLGLLSTLLLAPDLLRGRSVLHVVDSVSTVLAWPRGRSVLDSWASTLIRATAHVCAMLEINLYMEWQPRRSDRCTKVVDNLSHDLCEDLLPVEVQAYLMETQLGFPSPLLKWLRNPRSDFNLGPKLIRWLENAGM